MNRPNSIFGLIIPGKEPFKGCIIFLISYLNIFTKKQKLETSRTVHSRYSSKNKTVALKKEDLVLAIFLKQIIG